MRHYLSANASSEIPSHLLFVDTEAKITHESKYTDALSLRLWTAEHVTIQKAVMRSCTLYHGFTAEDFWLTVDALQQPKKPLWIFAHNARYDMRQLNLWREFDEGRLIYNPALDRKHKPKGYVNSIIAIDGRPFFIRCSHKQGGTIWIVDSMNYWSISLSELGSAIGLPKLDIDLETSKAIELFQYCKRDTEIIRTAVVELITSWQRENRGNFRTSAAGLSLQNYRHFCCDDRTRQVRGIRRWNILCDKEDPVIDLERQSYFGGRIEVFKYGVTHGPIYHLDVSSMYPFIMRNGYFPINRLCHMVEPSIESVDKLQPAYDVVASVIINSKHDTFPVRHNNRQIHACGRFPTVLCGRELQRAFDTDTVERIAECQVYRTAPLFEQWVDYWYERRMKAKKAGDELEDMFCKLILNSLHGKFGQKGHKWIDRPFLEPPKIGTKIMRWGHWINVDGDTGETQECRVFNYNVQQQVDGEPPDHSFPAISAIISANAREYLRDMMQVCPAKSVLYVAVDSLIVTAAGYDALKQAGYVNANELGKLKIEGKYSECEIKSHGCYRLDDKWVACGLWGRSFLNGNNEWQALRWDMTDDFLEDHNPTVYVNTIGVQEPAKLPKGESLRDGWVKPFRFTIEQFEQEQQEQFDAAKLMGIS